MSTLHRAKKKELEYRDYLKNHVGPKGICVFCELDSDSPQVVKEHPLFWVIQNIFPYTLWDSTSVVEHLMVVPKRHIESLSKYTEAEILQHHKIVSAYEKKGYDVYARGVSSNMKSVAHQHSHLIKTDGKKIRGLLYIDKPLIHRVIR